MKYNPDIHKRRSIRLKGYDYSQAGAYFVTICTHNRKCVLGDIINGVMRLNDQGKIVESEWMQTAEIRRNVLIDEFRIMPNHLHGIIIIIETVGAHRNVPLPDFPQTEQFGKSTINSIPTIIKLFKSTTTKQINQLKNSPGNPVWQRNYFERVIRNKKELDRIREYVYNNPFNWNDDKDNPQNWNYNRLGNEFSLQDIGKFRYRSSALYDKEK